MKFIFSIDLWENRDTLVSHLAGQLQNNRLSLVLGAGASHAFGLPGWDRLIANMEDLFNKHLPEGSSLFKCAGSGNMEKAGEIREMFEKQGDYKGYISLVQEALYHGIDSGFEVLNERKILDAIAVLCIPSRRGAIKDIITFNFDNILEIYLKYYGIVSYSPVDGNLWQGNADVNVYHIHGFLPEEKEYRRWSKRIVFDKASYDEKKDYLSWEWTPQISSLLRSTTAIFIGLSGKDESMDLLLNDTYNHHACKTHPCGLFWGVAFIRKKDGLEPVLKRWKNWGVYPLVISGRDGGNCTYEDFEDAIKSFLLAISQKAAQTI